MSTRIKENYASIDSTTSRSICGEIGERLRQDLRPDKSGLPHTLQHLLDEMKSRESPSTAARKRGLFARWF
jgi:hypothetical protein